MYDIKECEPFPDLRDPVTGDWLPLSESDKKRIDEDNMLRKMSNSDIASLFNSILK